MECRAGSRRSGQIALRSHASSRQLNSARRARPKASTSPRATPAAPAEISTLSRARNRTRKQRAQQRAGTNAKIKNTQLVLTTIAQIESAISTIVSDSGRGSSTFGEIVKERPQNSRSPTIRDRGSPAARRAANSCTSKPRTQRLPRLDNQRDGRDAGGGAKADSRLARRVFNSGDLERFLKAR